MPADEIFRLIFSFLGGGVVVALVNVWNTGRIERKRRRIDFLKSQLQDLYGPLQFFTSCNVQLFRLCDDLGKAYKAEYIDKKYSAQQNTQERVRQDALQTIDLSNHYVGQVVENNTHVLEVLTRHYSLMDIDDANTFAQFIVDYTRYKTEHAESGRPGTPLEVYKRLGDIPFMRPEFIQVVETRFKDKKVELERLARLRNGVLRRA